MDLVEHRTKSRDPHERGYAYGAALAIPIRRALDAYGAYWARHGTTPTAARELAVTTRDATQAWWPEAVAELDAVAEGAGAARDDLFALSSRTEIMATTRTGGPGECSTVAVVAPPRPRSIQTWDWHPPLTPTGVLLEHPSATGGVKTFTEPGMLGKIGVNAAGLALHFNILHHHQDGGGAGVPVHVIARRVLCEARTIADAVEIASSCPLVASTVLTVVSGEGEQAAAACLELSPAGVAVVRPDVGGYLWHTNHFRDPRLAEGERTDSETTRPRGEHLTDVRDRLLGAQSPRELAASMCGTRGGQAAINVRADETLPPDEQVATLATMVCDPAAYTLHVSVGDAAVFAPRVF